MPETRGSVLRWTLGAFLAVVVLIGIVVGGYQLNWWLRGNAVNRNAKINRTSYEVQQTYREEVLKDLQQVATDDREVADPAYAASAAFIRAQRIHDIQVACDHISRLTTSGAGIDPDVQSFHDKECSA